MAGANGQDMRRGLRVERARPAQAKLPGREELLALRETMSYSEIGRKYGVNTMTVWAAINGHPSRSPKNGVAVDLDERVFGYIVEFKRAHNGLSPTYEQISQRVGVSKSCAFSHVRQLARVGRIRVTENGIEVTGSEWTINN